MALSFSTACVNAMADAIVTALGSSAVLQIRSGSKPAGPGTAATGTLLASITLDSPAFGSAAGGVITLDVSPAKQDTSADNTGTAGWFRLQTSGGTGVVDGTVTATGGGGDMTLNTVSIVASALVDITSGTITVPTG